MQVRGWVGWPKMMQLGVFCFLWFLSFSWSQWPGWSTWQTYMLTYIMPLVQSWNWHTLLFSDIIGQREVTWLKPESRSEEIHGIFCGGVAGKELQTHEAKSINRQGRELRPGGTMLHTLFLELFLKTDLCGSLANSFSCTFFNVGSYHSSCQEHWLWH